MNDLNSPPLPQPSGANCPNRGAAQNPSAAYCTNCGARLATVTPSSPSPTSKMVLSTLPTPGALVFGAFGGRMTLFAITEGMVAADWTRIPVSVVPLALACIWGIFRINRKS